MSKAEVLLERDVAQCRSCSKPFRGSSPERVVKYSDDHGGVVLAHEACYRRVNGPLFKQRENMFGSKVWGAPVEEHKERIRRAIYTAMYLDVAAKGMPHCEYLVVSMEQESLCPAEMKVHTVDKWCADLSNPSVTSPYCMQVPPEYWSEAYSFIDLEVVSKSKVVVDLPVLVIEWITKMHPKAPEWMYLLARNHERVRVVVRVLTTKHLVPRDQTEFESLDIPVKTVVKTRVNDLAESFKNYYGQTRLRARAEQELQVSVSPRVVSRADVHLTSQYHGVCRLLLDRQDVPVGCSEDVYGFGTEEKDAVFRVDASQLESEKSLATVPFRVVPPSKIMVGCPTRFLHVGSPLAL